VLGLEVRDSLFDLAAPLRIFFAQLVRYPVDLKTFEQALCVEFIPRAVRLIRIFKPRCSSGLIGRVSGGSLGSACSPGSFGTKSLTGP
jgi:hypothetical protein